MSTPSLPPRDADPWRALWAMMVGFFMILVDATIVAVANPSIMEALHADYDAVIWVTSAYLLAYAVPLLLAGRLGDRYGPKNLYLLGLAVFTGASLWCGLAGSIEVLIAARVLQGVGAALLTPQTLSSITRLFPASNRGVAMSVWGATAGVATLVGPIAGGFLVDGLGWHWIFIVNVPIGIVGLVLAYWLVPTIETSSHALDVPGVVLSGIGMFFVVFALQEGQSHDWAAWIWVTIVAGLGFLAAFVYWQSVNPREPLIPLRMFRDRNFSLSTAGIAVIGFAVTAMILPVMFYAQAVAGLSPTRAAILTAPMAVASGVLAPFVGRMVDRVHPTPIVGFGFSALAVGMTWLSAEMTPTTPIWRLVLPLTLVGVGMAFIWSPLATTATRNLPPDLAGAGSGVYNAVRQVGGVLGSAGMAAFMTARISAEMPGGRNRPAGTEAAVTSLPEFLRVPFSAALSQALLLPAFVALFGIVATLFLRSGARRPARVGAVAAPTGGEGAASLGRVGREDGHDEHDFRDDFRDDDEYVEYVVDWDDSPLEAHPHRDVVAADESATAPLPAPAHEGRVAAGIEMDAESDAGMEEVTDVHPAVDPVALPEPDQEPDRRWRSILDDLLAVDGAPPDSGRHSNGHARNGFHVDGESGLHSLPPSGGRHGRGDGEGGPGRHARD